MYTQRNTETHLILFILHGGVWRHLLLAYQSLKRDSSPQRGVQFLSIFFYMKKEGLDKMKKLTPCLHLEHLVFISSFLHSTQRNTLYASCKKAFCARNRLIIISPLFYEAPLSMQGIFVPSLFWHGRVGEF